MDDLIIRGVVVHGRPELLRVANGKRVLSAALERIEWKKGDAEVTLRLEIETIMLREENRKLIADLQTLQRQLEAKCGRQD